MKAEQTMADELMLRMAEKIFTRHDASMRCPRALRDSVQAANEVIREIVKQRSEGIGECTQNGAGVSGGRMKQFKVTLSIGYPQGTHEDIIEIPKELLDGKSEEELQEVLDKEWREWAWEHIDGGITEIKELKEEKSE